MASEPPTMRRLLGAIAAQSHAAPAAFVAARMVGKEQGAGGALAGLDIREILRADEARQRLADRQQQ